MGKQYKTLKPEDADFIKEQKVFFVASSSGKEVNLSPKGYQCLKSYRYGHIAIYGLSRQRRPHGQGC
jgi:hypothetical protein